MASAMLAAAAQKTMPAALAGPVLLALFLLHPFLPLAEAQTAGDPLLIGFVAPLTGPKASFGAPAREGFELGLKEAAPQRLNVLYEDDQFQPALTVAAFKKFTDMSAVDLTISVGSVTGNAIAPLAEQHKMPLIAWAADSKVSKGRTWVVRPYFGENESMELTAQEAKRLGYEDIAVLVSTNDFSLAVRQSFLQHMPHEAIDLSEEFPPDLTDFRTLLLKVKAKGIKQLFLCALGGQIGTLAKQAHEIGFMPSMFGCSNLAAPAELAVSGGALRGAWLFNPKIDPSFTARYREAYGPSGELWPAALFYDLALLLNSQVANGATKDRLLARLLERPSPGGALSGFRLAANNGDCYLQVDLEKCVVGEKDC